MPRRPLSPASSRSLLPRRRRPPPKSARDAIYTSHCAAPHGILTRLCAVNVNRYGVCRFSGLIARCAPAPCPAPRLRRKSKHTHACARYRDPATGERFGSVDALRQLRAAKAAEAEAAAKAAAAASAPAEVAA